jgi:calcineurin-like phosphoesterase family protein
MEGGSISRRTKLPSKPPRIACALLLAWALCAVHTAAAAADDPVLVAVGDIACAPGEKGACQQLATANLASSLQPSAVAVLGDNQYQSALLSEFHAPGAYDDTWGRFNPIVHPAAGNHEYEASTSAAGYFAYFGSSAGDGYYSYDLGSWHVIVLNSDCDASGCRDSLAGTTSSAEVAWLQSDLATHRGRCTLAYWHHPRFSSGFVGNSPGVAPFWDALYAARADVGLNGHDHMYERFAQQDPLQQATPEGIREFVVGTGGESLFDMGTIQPNMETADDDDFGVLFLTLHPGSYDWAFRATDGRVVDSGSAACHPLPGPAPPVAPPPVSVAAAPPPSVARLQFTARLQRFGAGFARRYGLPVSVHCSRACDLVISLRVRRAGRVRTLARYRRTEVQITRPLSRIVLPLPRRLSIGALLSRAARTRLDFQAVDAAGERRALTLRLPSPARPRHRAPSSRPRR